MANSPLAGRSPGSGKAPSAFEFLLDFAFGDAVSDGGESVPLEEGIDANYMAREGRVASRASPPAFGCGCPENGAKEQLNLTIAPSVGAGDDDLIALDAKLDMRAG